MTATRPYVIQDRLTFAWWVEPAGRHTLGHWTHAAIEATPYPSKADAERARSGIRVARQDRSRLLVVTANLPKTINRTEPTQHEARA